MNDSFIIIRMEIRILRKHVVNAGKHHTRDGDNGFLIAPLSGKPLVFDGKVRCFLAFNSGKGALDQQWLQVLSGFGTSGRLFPVGTLVIGRGKSSSGAKMFIGFKDRHVRTNLREDEQCREFCNSRDSGNAFYLFVIRPAPAEELQLNLADGLGQEIHMGFSMCEFETLLVKDLIAADTVKYFVIRSLDAAMEEGKAFLFIKRPVRKQVIHDAGGRFSEGISKDTVYPDTGDGHAALVTVLFSGTHTGEFETVSGKLTQCTDVSRGNKRSFDDIKAE